MPIKSKIKFLKSLSLGLVRTGLLGTADDTWTADSMTKANGAGGESR